MIIISPWVQYLLPPKIKLADSSFSSKYTCHVGNVCNSKQKLIQFYQLLCESNAEIRMYVKSSFFSYFSFFLFVFQRNSKNCFLVVRRATTTTPAVGVVQSARDHHHPSYRRLTKAVSEFDALRLRRRRSPSGDF